MNNALRSSYQKWLHTGACPVNKILYVGNIDDDYFLRGVVLFYA